MWTQNILPIIQFGNSDERLIFFKKTELFPVAHWLRGCISQVCVLYFKANSLLVVMKVTFKNNHLSTKELQRKYDLSYLSPSKSGLELPKTQATFCITLLSLSNNANNFNELIYGNILPDMLMQNRCQRHWQVINQEAHSTMTDSIPILKLDLSKTSGITFLL